MLFIAGSTSVVRSVLIASLSIHNLTAVMSGTAILLFYSTTILLHFLVLLRCVYVWADSWVGYSNKVNELTEISK